MKSYYYIFLGILFSQAALASTDPMNIVGTYQCRGLDSRDGRSSSETVFTRDEQASNPKENFGAYRFNSSVSFSTGSKDGYSGYAAIHGNTGAMFFENKNKNSAIAKQDYGVNVVNITYEKDDTGGMITHLSGVYYQPQYEREAKNGKAPGGTGSWDCTKIN